VSVNPAGTASGNSDSFAPVITANGRLVAFRSTAGDLTTNDTNDVLVRNLR
jgi:hypothetical protein